MKNFVRMVMLSAVVSVCLAGCGNDNGTNNGGGNNIPPVDPSTVVKDVFTDDRDGTVYKTVKIGSQTWMAENLNYQTDKSCCYNDSDSYCGKYGRLYIWDAAKTACPNGWHLPDKTAWVRLMNAVGGRKSTGGCLYEDCIDDLSGVGAKLKATSGWDDYQGISNGTDDYGFTALPGGSAGSTGIGFGAGITTIWWTASEWEYYYNGVNIAAGVFYYVNIGSGSDKASIYHNDKNQHNSVRCLKDD